jgi:hypothetical protein
MHTVNLFTLDRIFLFLSRFFFFSPTLIFVHFRLQPQQRGIGCEENWHMRSWALIPLSETPAGWKAAAVWWWGGKKEKGGGVFSSLSPVTYLKPRKVLVYPSLTVQLVDSVDGALLSLSQLNSFVIVGVRSIVLFFYFLVSQTKTY